MDSQKTHIIRDSSILLKAFNNSEFFNVVFLVNGARFYALRKIVAGASDYFNTLLEGEFKESSQDEIKITKDIVYESNFLLILKYIYGIEINLNELCNQQVCELLDLTEYFNLSSLQKSVVEYLNSKEFDDRSFDSIVTVINLAALKSYDVLYRNAERFVLFNGQRVLDHPTFLNLDYAVLTKLLQSGNFYAGEYNILAGTLKWFDANSNKTSSDSVIEVNDKGKRGRKRKRKATKERVNGRNQGIEKSDLNMPQDENTKNSPIQLKELLKHMRNAKVGMFQIFKLFQDKEIANLFQKYQSELCDVLGNSQDDQ